MNNDAIEVVDLVHHYGARRAIAGLSLSVAAGEVFALLGPNGSGKTTLFRVLSTLAPVQQGQVKVFGADVSRQQRDVRASIGVVFQAPGLDKKLTVMENIRCQAALYGITGETLRTRASDLLERLNIADRADERTETLSGGLRRRVEIAKGMIHRPKLLLMDEPSAGLDPGARADVWACLTNLRDQFGVTVMMTTHLLDEAEKADRIAILHEGQVVADGAPSALRASVGGDTITIETDEPAWVADQAQQKFGVTAQVLRDAARLAHPDARQLITKVAEEFAGKYASIRLGRPTLEDVFIAKTGRRFWQETPDSTDR